MVYRTKTDRQLGLREQEIYSCQYRIAYIRGADRDPKYWCFDEEEVRKVTFNLLNFAI